MLQLKGHPELRASRGWTVAPPACCAGFAEIGCSCRVCNQSSCSGAAACHHRLNNVSTCARSEIEPLQCLKDFSQCGHLPFHNLRICGCCRTMAQAHRPLNPVRSCSRVRQERPRARPARRSIRVAKAQAVAVVAVKGRAKPSSGMSTKHRGNDDRSGYLRFLGITSVLPFLSAKMIVSGVARLILKMSSHCIPRHRSHTPSMSL